MASRKQYISTFALTPFSSAHRGAACPKFSLQTMTRLPCPDCASEVDYEIGPDETLADVTDTAVLLQKIEGEEEVAKMDALLSLAITGGDFNWI